MPDAEYMQRFEVLCTMWRLNETERKIAKSFWLDARATYEAGDERREALMMYRSGIDAAWRALKEHGFGPDGKTALGDMIRRALTTKRKRS